jgi:hypothetical protein
VVIEKSAQQAVTLATAAAIPVVALLATSARIAANRFGFAANRFGFAADGLGFTTNGLGGATTAAIAMANPHAAEQLERVRSLGAADKDQQGRGERAN